MSEIKLGDWVRDTITAFEGYATGRVEYLTGALQIQIQPTTDLDGHFNEPRWFDEARVRVRPREANPLAKPAKRKGLS